MSKIVSSLELGAALTNDASRPPASKFLSPYSPIPSSAAGHGNHRYPVPENCPLLKTLTAFYEALLHPSLCTELTGQWQDGDAGC